MNHNILVSLNNFRIGLSEDFLESVVASEAAFWFKGDPEQLIAAIRTWVEEDASLNRPISRADLLAFALEKDFEIKQYEVDQAMPGRLSGATTSYDASYASIGAGLFSIPRTETDQLVAALLDEPSSKTVALVGSAGSGKSAIIRDAIERVAGRNHLQLAFRVDQVGEPASLAQLGTAVIDVADSPAIVLERLSGNRPAVLYIDQADAVSQMSGRSAQVRRQLVDLVNQARSYPNIRLVFSCRTFDVENDQLFSEIAERNETLRIDVAPFDWERDVAPVLQKLEISINPDSQKIKALLIQPIGLAIAAQLAANGIKDLRTVENLSELFDKLLTERDRAIRERHKPAWSVYAALEAIAREMSARQELVAPMRTLDAFAGAREILQQEGLIVINGQKISLLHESLFDFLHARAFAGGDQSLLDFLLSSEQTLFRRTQVRQILAAERELDPKRYLGDLESILTSDRVRPHVRDLVLRWLGSVPIPTADEWNQLARYAARRGDGEVPRSISMVIFDQPAWFALLAEGGSVQAWLQGSKDAQVWALRFIRSISDRGAELLPAILQGYLDIYPEQAGLVLDELHWLSPKQSAPALADVIIRALGMIDDLKHLEARGEGQFEAFGSWIPHAPDDAARILAASLSTWYRLSDEGTPFKPAFENGTGTFHHLVELAKARPIAMLDALLPAMRETMVRMPGREGGPPYQDHVWHWRRYERGEGAWIEMLDVVRNALARVAVDDPAEVERLLAIVEPAQQITGLHLLLETIASNGAGLAGVLAAQHHHPALFTAGWEGAPALSAAKALASSWDYLHPDQRGQFERQILTLWPELDDVKWALSMKEPSKNVFNRTPEEIRGMARHYLGLSGLRQWSVLQLIGEERLSPAAADRLRVLARKFAGAGPESPDIIRSGSVQSAIAPDRAAHMSDDAWLTAFEKLNGEGKREWTAAGFPSGAYELARVLQARVKDEPERFFGLLHRIPIDAHPAFANAIVMGISENSPGAEMTEKLFAAIDEKAVPSLEERTLVWLIRATQGEKGPKTLRFMLEVASSGASVNGGAKTGHCGGVKVGH
ncbi:MULTISPECIES: ATP-binding protein [unclassified Novosphingobium]|uniref:ATP-binding protein n=1 Tax=unclassified Novosphingobium TaxID=2644732 RepID=UPI000D30861E|nr:MULTISPECIES: ATP-binding protein [unclassified Novosphingobium]